jgi:hypothetical protein
VNRLFPGRSSLPCRIQSLKTTYKRRHLFLAAESSSAFPSTTTFVLALGAGSPYADEHCVGTLGLSATLFFTVFIVTYVSILTSHTSSVPHGFTFTGLENAPLPLTGRFFDLEFIICSSFRCSNPQVFSHTLRFLRSVCFASHQF